MNMEFNISLPSLFSEHFIYLLYLTLDFPLSYIGPKFLDFDLNNNSSKEVIVAHIYWVLSVSQTAL